MSQAYIVLIVMAVMIVAMVSDKFDFGFAPVAACTILVLTGTATVQQAYGGFINNNTIFTGRWRHTVGTNAVAAGFNGRY